MNWMASRFRVVITSQCLRCQRPLQVKDPLRFYSSKQGSSESRNPIIRYLQRLKWVPIPLGVGFAYIGYQQYGHIVKREEKLLQNATDPEETVAKDWQVKVYRALPLKAMSRLWGRVNNKELPMWLRSPLYKLYIWAFNCDLQEAAIRDLQHYRNLGEFFKRRLTPGCRPIDQQCSVTSPSDGRVLHFGRVDKGLIEQVKGVTYTLQGFLGPSNWIHDSTVDTRKEGDDEAYHSTVKVKDDNDLYHCVIYLAPGDYHGFHSPAAWTVIHRRHFPGELLSVNPGIARWIKGLFNLNERAVYIGEWEHGLFTMAAVGATNVGSIKVYHDTQLSTNLPDRTPPGVHYDETFARPDLSGIPMKKGESFGEFNLGSTIVVIFEAPKSFNFKLKHGQNIKFGQALGSCK